MDPQLLTQNTSQQVPLHANRATSMTTPIFEKSFIQMTETNTKKSAGAKSSCPHSKENNFCQKFETKNPKNNKQFHRRFVNVVRTIFVWSLDVHLRPFFLSLFENVQKSLANVRSLFFGEKADQFLRALINTRRN